ncbi:unnamed protein product [Brachionus calyciflorus]|uniref:Zinc finger PHD-type domain-containing protein n=1 Tax=Brachionus calyciflorus TaxID=104777 RepID=A0A813MJT5_9BILA|nr:unnamed protein product [Brachionus calyciflorus]
MSLCSFVTSQTTTTTSSNPSSSNQSSNQTQTLCSTLNEKPILTLSPKQVLMLNTNRINSSPDSSLQYVVKKSPTILILSKPKSSDLSPKPIVHKPHKSSSNLISSYFNNKHTQQQNNTSGPNTTSLTPNATPYHNLPIQYVPNSKPITLIPIGKLTQNTNTSNFNDNFNGSQLIPIETIEISTATIEINSTDDAANCADKVEQVVEEIIETEVNDVEIKVEKKEDGDEKEPIVEEQHVEKEEQNEDKKESIQDQEIPMEKINNQIITVNTKSDVTRCICEMDHDDGFMICCDNCLVWQHIACMEVNKKKIPDKFYCEKCDPRVVNAQRARQIQEKYLKNLSKNFNKIKNRRNSSSSNTTSVLTPQPQHTENEQIELKNEPIDDPISYESNIPSSPTTSSSDNNECKHKLKRKYKSRTIKEEYDTTKNIDDSSKETQSSSKKIQNLDSKSLNLDQIQPDILKVIKTKNKKLDELDDIKKYRVKITQNIQKDQIICEYLGQISYSNENCAHDLENYLISIKIPNDSELKPSTSSSSSSSTTNLNDLDSQIVFIDSSKLYNNSRYIRKSCKFNTRLIPFKDNKENLRFFVQSTENISKNGEVFLPADVSGSLSNLVCVCESNECEVKIKLSEKILKNTPVKSTKVHKESVRGERRPSTQSPGPTIHLLDDNKNLSREDRKLASYMRVIERLEKQNKRKKESKIKENCEKIESKLSEDSNDNKNSQGTCEKENEKILEKISKKSKTSRPSLLVKTQVSETVDMEIASITEAKPLETNEEIKPTVKSPDYSFVNLSIQPRRTLNLLQRNLESDDENRFSPALESLENNKNFLTNKSFFHPKKHWLKTCSNEDSQNGSSPTKNENPQPPKKRRVFIEESSIEPLDNTTVQPNEQLNINIQPSPPVFFPPEHQLYLNFLNFQMSSPNFLSSAPISSCSTPNFYTPNQFYPPDLLHFHQLATMSLYQNIMNPSLPFTSLPSPQSNTSLTETAPEATKKKVSLAEYRQRKESIKPSEILFESISSTKSFNNDDSLCELDVYPTNETQAEITENKEFSNMEKIRHSSASSCSSRCSRKSSISNISVISSCSSIRSRSPSSSSQRSHSSRLSSFEAKNEHKIEEPKYFKFKYQQDDNLKRKKLDDMLDEYRNEGLKLKEKPRTRSCSLNRSFSQSRSESSLDENNWKSKSDRKYFPYKKRSNSLNRRRGQNRRWTEYDRVRPSRSNEDYLQRFKFKKFPNTNKFDLRFYLKNKCKENNNNNNNKNFSSNKSSCYGSSSCSSTSSIASSNDFISLTSTTSSLPIKKF